MREVLDRGIAPVVEAENKDNTAAISRINMNVMDASAAPGVTAPEPGGLESREVMQLATLLGEKGTPSVIEISELSPVYDVSDTTSKLAACIILRLMAANCKERGEIVEQSIRRGD